MGSNTLYERIGQLDGISLEDLVAVFEAVSEAFPMIILGNLTKNTYTMIKDEGFMAGEVPVTGRYDDLIEFGVQNIHPNYQGMFLEHFTREHLLDLFEQGKNEISFKLYQKGRGQHYQWVSARVYRVRDKDGDIREVSIHKVLEPEHHTEVHRFSGEPCA